MHAFLFPGQGAQAIGMGKDLAENFLVAKNVFEEVNDALNQDLSALIWDGDIETLTLTENAQPALMATSIAAIKSLESEGIDFGQASYIAGHSLGEYSALLAAGSIELDAALQLVYKRGLFMSEAPSGSMLAVMGLEISVIDKICNDISNEGSIFVAPANINTPNQIVIGGDHKAIDIASIKLKEEGAKRCIKLKVSTASHCLLMKESALKLQKELENIDIIKPTIGVVQNVDARLAETPEFIKNNLISQLTSPVQWVDTMKRVDSNKGILIECGPGKVLSGLAKQNGIENILTMSSQNFEEDLRNML